MRKSLVLCFALLCLLSLYTCDRIPFLESRGINKNASTETKSVGRYQLHSIQASGTFIIFVIDTVTGETKEVAMRTRNSKNQAVYGDQFGIPFDIMSRQPNYTVSDK